MDTSEQAIAEAQASTTKVISVEGDKATVRDARERIIVVQKLSALAFYRLSKVLPDSAKDQTVDLATLAASVRKINTQDFATPASDRDIEFILQQLDFDGLAAASEGLRQLSKMTPKEVESSKN